MVCAYRTFGPEAARELVARELFGGGPAGAEGFALQVELLASRWDGAGRPAGPVLLEGQGGLRAAVEGCAGDRGLELLPPGPLASALGAPRAGFGAGGQLRIDSGLHATPAAAAAALEAAADALERVLAAQGIALLGAGWDPFHASGRRPLQDPSGEALSRARALAAVGELGAASERLGAGARVRVGLGGPGRAALRWRAAQLLAPLATALFASSPLEQGGFAGCKSLRARARRRAEPSRVGFPPQLIEGSRAAPAQQHADFGLRARVLWVRRGDRLFPLARPTSFASWLEHGLDGQHPEAGDWREHLETLRPEVRPDGGLELASADAQGRAFRSVPLTLWSALLCDDAALGAVLARLAGRELELDARWDLAAREGLLDPDLAADARWLVALAADALLRAPPGWIERGMLAAFVAFAERFALRGRAPADELLEASLGRGGLDRRAWEGLERGWCEAAGRAPLA